MRTIQTYTNQVPFFLGKKAIEVMDYSQACEIDLETTYDKFEAANNTLGDHLMGWVIGDRSKGVQSTEKMLKNDTVITAIGELIYNTNDGKVQIQAPSNGDDYYLIQETPKNLVKRFESGTKILKISLFIFASVGIFIGSYAAWKTYTKWKRYQETNRTRNVLRTILDNRSEQRGQNTTVENRDDIPDIPNVQACVVCLGQQREVILLDCGHVCVCADCATEIMRTNPLCPVCRSNIDRVAPAYIA